MFIQKNYTLRGIWKFTGGHIIWLTMWVSTVVGIFEFSKLKWLFIPWLPVSIIGTAVAFYVGFKNNQSYDRLWEARKIWGAIVNSSRAWGAAINSFVSDQFASRPIDQGILSTIKQKLIYRHIAWLYILREQLLIPTSWEHINQNSHIRKRAQMIMKKFGRDMYDKQETEALIKSLLPPDEYAQLQGYKNAATQLIEKQSAELANLRKEDLIDDFRHMELQNLLQEFYVHQGKNERIKKFPLPRQYGGMSAVFIGIFIFLLPFAMIPEFSKLGDFGVWIAIPVTVAVAWVYLVMELVGDYSENPFEGLGNDVPMLSICRTIEIDLRQMLGETELPPPIEAKNNVLM